MDEDQEDLEEDETEEEDEDDEEFYSLYVEQDDLETVKEWFEQIRENRIDEANRLEVELEKAETDIVRVLRRTQRSQWMENREPPRNDERLSQRMESRH